MKRGRPRKSTVQKKLEGNPGKRKLQLASLNTEPSEISEAGKLRCPARLLPAAKTYWKQIVPELASQGLVNKLDQAILEMLCQNYARWQQAEKELEAATVETNHGKVVHPAAKAALQYENAYLKLAQELGLTPASRNRLEQAATPAPAADYFLEFEKTLD